MPDDPRARHLQVHGRVQGVFFRAATVRQAERHGVDGWVRNCPDGTLEVRLQGPRDGVDAIERWVRGGGPPAAQVTEVVATDAEPRDLGGFEVRR